MIRHYRPEDAEAVKAIFAKQSLDTYLPLPENDKAVCVALVAEENGVVKRAVFFRMIAEAYYVGDPEEPDVAQKILKLSYRAEGALLELSKRLRELRYGALTSITAMIPKKFPLMVELLELIGFGPAMDKPGDFTLLYARTGEHENGSSRSGKESSGSGS